MSAQFGHIAFVVLSCCGILALASETGQRAKEMRASFSFEGKSIVAAARSLSAAFQKRLCMEETAVYSGISVGEKEAVQRVSSQKEEGIPMAVTNGTLAEILDARCAFDRVYEWTCDQDTGVVNVYPTKDAPFSWRIPAIAFTNLSVTEIFLEQDLLDLKRHRVLYDIGSGNLSWLKSKISLERTNITARAAINRICAQIEPPMRWDLYSTPVRGGVIDFVLMFRPVGMRTKLSIDAK